MNKKKYFNLITACLFCCAIHFSCESFLEEEALDFKSSSNSFVTKADFDKSVINLYRAIRSEFYSGNQNHPFDYQYGTDLVFDGQPSEASRFHDLDNTCNPNGDYLTAHWTNLYKIISETNTIINRLKSSSVAEADQLLIEGQAKFFRALAYRTLVFLYGGVPLELTEVTTPRKDYIRASKEDVLNQAISDLLEAEKNLPEITKVKDGEISNLVASHLLSEVYLALGNFTEAHSAASKVIDNPNMGLMKERFGSTKSQPGDVYYDLFRVGNQNRLSAGNKEALWVIQFDIDTPGGENPSTGGGAGYKLERQHSPMLSSIAINGENLFLWPTTTLSSCGRGVGWAIPTLYFSNIIWESSDWNDMRNSNYNFVREHLSDDPTSKYFGQIISTENPPAEYKEKIPNRGFYAHQSKASTPMQHPEPLIVDPATGLLHGNSGTTHSDQYMFRLTETYLLRAEASLGMNKKTDAANDINVIRDRAKAKLVTPEEVDIDYILDERMRELGLEEKRRLTLGRLEQVYRRTVQIAKNPEVKNMAEKHNLWPIPYSEIERNTDAVIEQNPEY